MPVSDVSVPIKLIEINVLFVYLLCLVSKLTSLYSVLGGW